MNKSSRILAACGAFLDEHAPAYVAPTIVKPYPDSSLHEKTLEVLQHELYEARRVQHLLTQFSAEETKHLAYVDEATSIITYKQLDELSKNKLLNYTRAAASDMQIQGMRQGSASVSAANSENPLVKQDKKDQEKTAAKKASKRFGGILKATRRLATEDTEQLDELSVKTLKNYKEKASDAVGSYKYGSKSPTMDIGTVNKRVKGFVKAGAKLSDRIKAATTLIKSNESVEQLDELSKDTLYSYKSKAEKQFADGGVDKKPKNVKEYKSLEQRVKGIDRAETKLQKEDLDEARGPLKDHPYHTKSDSELHFIIKDAGEAAKAMKDHSPKSEAKYLDQVNDASTVLHYRKNGGKQLPKETAKPSTVIESFDNNSARNRIKNLLG